MAEKVRFSPTHGHNILLTNSATTATWSPEQSGGWVFSVIPMESGQTVVVKLIGSGHCDLGFIKEDPRTTNMMNKPPTFKQMNEIRIHKMACSIPISINDKGTKLSSRFQDKAFLKKLDRNTKLWLTIYIKFGTITAKLLLNGSSDDPIKFSDHHGANIRLEEDHYLATTISPNPASTCFVMDNIYIGMELVLQCSPLLEADREPSRYHLKLQVYERNPESLKNGYGYLFDSRAAFTSEPPVTTLELLDKEECKGNVVVTLTNATTVAYTVASSKYNEQRLRDKAPNGIWVVLGLHRISVTASRRATSSSRTDCNVIDAVMREPSNEHAENSMDQLYSMQHRTVVKRQVSDYAEAVDARNPEVSVREKLTSLEHCQKQLHTRVDTLAKQFQTASRLTHGDVSAPLNCSPTRYSREPIPVQVSSVRVPKEKDRAINVRPQFSRLVSDIICSPLCDKLFEQEIITQNEYQEMTSEANPADANRKLLQTMMKKQVQKSKMDTVLDDIGQGYLKDMF